MGLGRRSGELWVAVRDQVLSVRSVRRIAVEQRLVEDCIEVVNRVP